MRLFLLGATGKTGTELVTLALARGHEVTAFVRSPHKLDRFDKLRVDGEHGRTVERTTGLTIVRGDVLDRDALAAALPGHDAVLSAIGVRPRDALRPCTLMTDSASSTVDGMKTAGVTRLAIVSAAVLFPEKGVVLRVLPVAAEASCAQPGRDGTCRTAERSRVDDRAAASIDEVARSAGSRPSKRAAAGRTDGIVPVRRRVHAQDRGASVAHARGRWSGAVMVDRQTDLAVFESHRALLLALAYRMLGDIGRAEDMVQEAWLRWEGRRVAADSPRAYLVTTVTRLCLNELDSATTRREQSRSDRLPEPVDLHDGGIGRVEMLDQISMAFLVVLQRLTPAERAVLLLRDVFDFGYGEISALIGKTEPACRKLLERARANIGREKRSFSTSRETHLRLLDAFTKAASAGDVGALVAILAEDAVMITDGGAEGRRVEGIRNLRAPLHGAAGIAAFIVATAGRARLDAEVHELNGQPALVLYEQDAPFAALLLGIVDDRVHRVFFHADTKRLRYLGARRR